MTLVRKVHLTCVQSKKVEVLHPLCLFGGIGVYEIFGRVGNLSRKHHISRVLGIGHSPMLPPRT